MNIRFAEERDINQIINLCKLHANFEKSSYDLTNKEALLLKYFFGVNSPVKCLVVVVDKEIVGYATLMKQFSTWDVDFYIYLDCIYFKEGLRGMGFGTQVMERIKEYAKSENCKIIQWQTPNFNDNAIAFYEKLGASSKSKERFSWDI